jgi:hypothetical protein
MSNKEPQREEVKRSMLHALHFAVLRFLVGYSAVQALELKCL